MKNEKNIAADPFQKTGGDKLYSIIGISLLVLGVLGVCVGFAFSAGLYVSLGILGFFAAFYFLHRVLLKPSLALEVIFILSFLIIGFTRVMPGPPLGLVIDSLIVLTWILIFFKYFKKDNWFIMRNTLTACLGIWAVYCILQILNPEATSKIAWIYAVRDIALKGILLSPLIFLLYNKHSDFKRFIDIWFGASFLLGIYAAKQFWIGVFGFEQVWLNGPGAVTHMLWGEFTRMFSFLSDANQFGSSQAHTATVAAIFSITEKRLLRKLFYYLTAAVCFYGMIISGTRASIMIPIVGLSAYLVFSKNFKILAIGSITGGLIMYLLIFTFVLHSIAPVRRMRTAFNPDDVSFQERLDNREILEEHLKMRPFGCGIGSSERWGQRFSPNTFISTIATDGQYVKIWVETGIVGLSLFTILYVVIMGKIVLITWRLKTPKLRNEMTGMSSGLLAALLVNYTSHFTGGLPTSLIVIYSMAFVFMSEKWDKEEDYPHVESKTFLNKRNNIS